MSENVLIPAKSKTSRKRSAGAGPVCEAEWIRLYPFGMALGALAERPVFLFKDESKRWVLPVWMTSTEAAWTLTGRPAHSHQSPFAITTKLLQSMGAKLERCVFVELEGHHQWVDIYFENHPLKQQKMRVKAAEVMGLCLYYDLAFYAKRDFILACRQMEAEVFQTDGLQLDLKKIRSRSHPYLM